MGDQGTLVTPMFSFAVYSSLSIPDTFVWTGPEPVLYWGLDNLDGLVLMEGAQQTDFDAFTDGKVIKICTEIYFHSTH